MNWDLINRQRPKGFSKYRKNKKWSELEILSFKTKKKKQMDADLEKYGWQTCPRCGGGRHPSYPTCKKCKSNNLHGNDALN